MVPKTATVTVAIEEHWLVGSLPVGEGRIQDTLNQMHSDFIQLTDVEIHQHWKRRCVAKIQRTLIPKRRIEFVIAAGEQRESPDRRLNHYRAKDRFRTVLTVGGNTISGDLHLPRPSTEIRHTLVSELAAFFPLTDARLTGRMVEDLSVPLLLINKRSVSSFDVATPAAAPPAASREPESLAWLHPHQDESITELMDTVRGMLSDPDAETVVGDALAAATDPRD
jgi:hypothetical protein